MTLNNIGKPAAKPTRLRTAPRAPSTAPTPPQVATTTATTTTTTTTTTTASATSSSGAAFEHGAAPKVVTTEYATDEASQQAARGLRAKRKAETALVKPPEDSAEWHASVAELRQEPMLTRARRGAAASAADAPSMEEDLVKYSGGGRTFSRVASAAAGATDKRGDVRGEPIVVLFDETRFKVKKPKLHHVSSGDRQAAIMTVTPQAGAGGGPSFDIAGAHAPFVNGDPGQYVANLKTLMAAEGVKVAVLDANTYGGGRYSQLVAGNRQGLARGPYQVMDGGSTTKGGPLDKAIIHSNHVAGTSVHALTDLSGSMPAPQAGRVRIMEFNTQGKGTGEELAALAARNHVDIVIITEPSKALRTGASVAAPAAPDPEGRKLRARTPVAPRGASDSDHRPLVVDFNMVPTPR